MNGTKEWILVVAVLAIGAGQIALSAPASSLAVISPPSEVVEAEASTDLLFAGHFYSYIADSEPIFRELDLLKHEAFVFGGDAIWNGSEESQQAFEAAFEQAGAGGRQVLAVRGNHDINASVILDRSTFGVTVIGDVAAIVLDTTTQTSGGESCGLDRDQLAMLRDAVKLDVRHKVIFMHHALWANPGFLSEMLPNHRTICAADYWQANVLPIIDGKVDLVVSGDGGTKSTFELEERNGVRYLLTGSPIHERVRGGANEGGPVDITLARIRSLENQLIVDEVVIGDPVLAASNDETDLPVYSVTVDEAELRQRYSDAPFYEYGTGWQEMIEPAAISDWIQRPIAGVLAAGSDQVPVELSIRGNVGNHWASWKKSWDISYVNGEGRQIKLILPADRAYVSQMFAVHVSDYLNVPTPRIDLVGLVVNDHDFGLYLRYEDFDEPFIELNNFSSDTRPAKSVFRDRFGVYRVTDALGDVTTVGGKGNNTEQQLVSWSELDSDNFTHVFEQDAFARWLAVRMFLGDRHQGETDNFRFFLDRSTGRYVVLMWDANQGVVNSERLLVGVGLVETFYNNPENAALTDQYLDQLIANAPSFRDDLVQMIATYGPMFVNEPGIAQPPVRIDRQLDRLVDLLDTNLEAFKAAGR